LKEKNYIPEAKNASIQKEMDVETVNNKSFGGFISGLDPTKKISAGISLEEGEGIYPVGCAGMAGLVLIAEETDGSPKKLSCQEELSKYFAPVDSPEEAFSFAHLQEGGRPLQNLSSDEPLYEKVQKIPPITAYSDGSYEVVLTVSDPCMHEYYPALRYYLVERDGTVSASSSSFSQN
jgi:hypothetical protein